MGVSLERCCGGRCCLREPSLLTPELGWLGCYQVEVFVVARFSMVVVQ